VRDLHKLKTFAGEDVFHVVVESPRGSVVKLKYSPDLEAMPISRLLVLGVTYPCDWGFVPSTEGPDRDPIDAAIWWDVTTYPGVVIPCRALAVVRVEQNGATAAVAFATIESWPCRSARDERLPWLGASVRRSSNSSCGDGA
jgi:inorganic pyrophosphatase